MQTRLDHSEYLGFAPICLAGPQQALKLIKQCKFELEKSKYKERSSDQDFFDCLPRLKECIKHIHYAAVKIAENSKYFQNQRQLFVAGGGLAVRNCLGNLCNYPESRA